MALDESMLEAIKSKLEPGTALLIGTAAEVFLSNIDPKNAKLIKAMEERGGIKPGRWMHAGIKGALCFMADERGEHHFRVFRIPDAAELFTVALANDLQYKQLNDGFHYFHSEECSVGFNFVDRIEARNFFMIVSARLPVKFDSTKPRSVKKSTKERKNGTKRGGLMGKVIRRGSKIMKRMSKGRRKSTKSSNLLFSPDELDTEWKQKLQDAGIKKKDLLDPKMQKLIHSIVFNKNDNENKNEPPKESVKIASVQPQVPSTPKAEMANKQNPYSRAVYATAPPTPRRMSKFQTSSVSRVPGSPGRRPSKTSGATPVLLPTSDSQSRKGSQFVPNLFGATKSLQEVEDELDDFLDDEKFSRVQSSADGRSSTMRKANFGMTEESLPPPLPPRSAAHNQVLQLRRDSKEQYIPPGFLKAESNVPALAPGALPQFNTLDHKVQAGIVARLREEVMNLRERDGPAGDDVSDGWTNDGFRI